MRLFPLFLAACASAPGQVPPAQSQGWWVIGWTNPADSGLADYVALIAGGDSLTAERILLHAEQDERLVTGHRFGRPVIAMTRAAWLAAGNPDVGQSEVVRVSVRREGRTKYPTSTLDPGYFCPPLPAARPGEVAAMAEQIESRNLTLDLGGEGEHQVRLLVSMLEEYQGILARCAERSH